MSTHVIQHAQADITYDVHGPLPTAGGRPPLMMIGQPMAASGFRALAALMPERTVITYDPRGMDRSTRHDGRVDASPTVQAEDVHAVIEAVGAGPVDLFASSGGAVTALALVAAHPDDVVTLVAHEPPLIDMLPDKEAARRASDAVQHTYEAKGWGHGMAAFMALTMWQGEYTDAYFAQPAPDPAQFGMPTEDDGTREDPLLTDRGAAIRDYHPDARRARRRADADRDRRGGGVARDVHRPHGRWHRGVPGPGGDRVPEPSRRLPGRRVRLGRAARGVRGQAPRGARLARPAVRLPPARLRPRGPCARAAAAVESKPTHRGGCR